MGEKYLHEEEIAAQLLPPSYFETVYDQYFGEWMENEVNNVAVWIDTLFKQVVYRRNEVSNHEFFEISAHKSKSRIRFVYHAHHLALL